MCICICVYVCYVKSQFIFIKPSLQFLIVFTCFSFQFCFFSTFRNPISLIQLRRRRFDFLFYFYENAENEWSVNDIFSLDQYFIKMFIYDEFSEI